MEAKTEVHLLANLQGPMQEPCRYSTAILSLSDQLSVPIPWLLHSSFPMGLACHPLRRDNQGLRKILHPDSKLEGVIQSVREWESESHPWVTHSNGCSMSLRRLGILCTSVRAQIAVSVLLKLNCLFSISTRFPLQHPDIPHTFAISSHILLVRLLCMLLGKHSQL